ncbi:MAG: AraC family transcriptional regulator [Verrucomicrobiota bacterium]
MRNYRPILLKDLEIRVPGTDVIRVCLNRHLPEADWVRRHRHEHAQFLCYLSGHGRQEVGGRAYDVRAGSLVLVPSGVEHAFRKAQVRAPLCVVVDVRLGREPSEDQVLRHLTSGQLTRVRHLLSELASLTRDDDVLRTAAVILRLVAEFSEVARDQPPRIKGKPIAGRVMKLLQGQDLRELRPQDIAREVGYQRDHLNRLLKREVGQTTGQLLAEARLVRAKHLLERGMKISDVGETVGFLDQNYFARWFKQQTGCAPSRWRGSA